MVAHLHCQPIILQLYFKIFSLSTASLFWCCFVRPTASPSPPSFQIPQCTTSTSSARSVSASRWLCCDLARDWLIDVISHHHQCLDSIGGSIMLMLRTYVLWLKNSPCRVQASKSLTIPYHYYHRHNKHYFTSSLVSPDWSDNVPMLLCIPSWNN